jgi:hypothetical protein
MSATYRYPGAWQKRLEDAHVSSPAGSMPHYPQHDIKDSLFQLTILLSRSWLAVPSRRSFRS